MKRAFGYLGLIAIGVLLGVVLGRGNLSFHKTEVDKAWETFSTKHEDAVHSGIMQYQQKLDLAASVTDADAVEADIKAQTAIEELIVQSREAQYAKFSVLGTSVIAAFSAVLGAIVSIALAKPTR